MSNSKIFVYSLPDLKNTTDDALPSYLTSLKFSQSHFLTDIRLGLGYCAVIIAAVTFYFDWKLGWDKTKDFTVWAVVAYFILNGALTAWIWGAEKGKVFLGDLNGAQITIASSMKKHTPIYNLTVRYQDPRKSDAFDWETIYISSPFTRWFSTDGQFVAKPFQEWLASEIPIVGSAVQAFGTDREVPISKQALGQQDRDTKEKASLLTEGSATGSRSRKGKK